MRPDETGAMPPSRGRDRARALRRAATGPERRLWWHLRRKLPLVGTYFRRQVPLGPYFADFACLKHRLVIELDGGQHTSPEAQRHDAERTAFLEAQGFRVLRFWNDQVFSEIDGVIETIHSAIEAAQTFTPDPSLQGQGEVDAPSPKGRGEWYLDQGEAEALARALLGRLASGTPPNVALMHLLMGSATPEGARDAVARGISLAEAGAVRDGAETTAALLEANPDSWRAIHTVTSSVAHEAASSAPETALAYWTAAFDRLARTAPEPGVALYALGNPDLLAAATAEVVASLESWGLLGPQIDVLDLGCGTGRFARALAPRVRSVLGLDLSGEMVAECRRRGALPNLRFEQSSGRDLARAATAAFDLVLAADVFPYLVQAGGRLPEDHVEEAARVLRPGGSLVILNYSYRGDGVLDGSDLACHAEAFGFDVLRAATREFRLWDAATFHLVRR